MGSMLVVALLVACRSGAPAIDPTPTATAPPVAATATPSPTLSATPTPDATVVPAETPMAPGDVCPGDGPRVCLVPLAGFSEPPVHTLVEHLVLQGIPALEAPPVGLEVADIDRTRSQLSANKAAARVEMAYPHLVGDPDVTVIALTDYDIFIEGLTLNWAFGMRGLHTNVISTARMHEEFWSGPRDDARRDSRLRKMLLRYVGLLHLRLPENDSPLTVLYRNLNGLAELDAMWEGVLEPSQLPQPTTATAQWASGFCAASELFSARMYRAEGLPPGMGRDTTA